MWIAKSSDEIHAADKSRLTARMVSILALILALLYLIVTASFWHGVSLGFVTLPLTSIDLGALSKFAAAAVVCWTAFSLVRSRLEGNARTLVCQNCNRIKTNDGDLRCECGGGFRGIHEMKWVDNHRESVSDTQSKELPLKAHSGA